MITNNNALSRSGCRVRRNMNYCEQIPQCKSRQDFDTGLPCPVGAVGVGNPTILSLLSLLTDQIQGTVEDEAVAENLVEITEAIEDMVVKIVANCGLGLGDEGAVRRRKNTQ